MSTFRGTGVLLVGAPGEDAGFLPSVGFVYMFQFALAQGDVSAAYETSLDSASSDAFTHKYVFKLSAETTNRDDNVRD